MSKTKIAMIGRKFGRWTVIAEAGKHGKSKAFCYSCRCECGTERIVNGSNLRSGLSVSCGCYNKDVVSKFGKSGVCRERLHGVWNNMKQRCTNENLPDYARYGGRGISVCDEWADSYEVFKKWALANGYCEGLTIDRIDNDGDYTPVNCRWVTNYVQARNKSSNFLIEINGVTKCLSDWSKESGMSRETLRKRVKAGMKDDDLLAPVDTR